MLRRLVSTFGFLAVSALALIAFSSPAAAQTLTFTGQVYSPLGPPVTGSNAAHGDPIPNILVFVQDPNSPLPTFSEGVTVPRSGELGCAIQPSLVPATVYGSASTDYTGTFTFNVASTLPDPVTVVIQAGKWRRKYQYTLAEIAGFTTGTQVRLPTMSMPSDQSEGDLPHIAVVTGSADAIECIFPQIGISTSEFTDPGGTGSINLFSGNASSGQVISATSPTETQLVNPSASKAIPMSDYDMVIFGCQSWGSGSTDPDIPLYANNVETYANEGGRVFGTHGEGPWFTTPADWAGIASLGGSTASGGTQTGQLSTSYTGEPALAAWMNYIGALDINAATLEFKLTNVFYNLTSVNAPGQTWVTLASHQDLPNQYSFDTPVNTSGSPAASLNFNNNQTTYDLGDANDSITINVSNTSATATQPGLTLTLQIPSSVTLTTLQDSSNGNWQCTQTTPTATCTLGAPLAPGALDAVTLTFSIPQTSTPGSATFIGTLSGGGINQTNQCGRVLYNDYHVESGISKQLFNNGASCSKSNTLTAAQKFLEYSLYNLSNFIAPTTSDVLVIQAPSTTTITTTINGVTNPGVETPIYYGQIIGDTDGVNALVSTTAPAGPDNGSLTVSVDGTVVCTLPNSGSGGTCPNVGFTGQSAGPHTVQAAFSGDTTYQPSVSPVYPVQILSDSTTTTIAASSSAITINNAVTLTSTVTAPYAVPAGPVSFYDGTTLLGTGTLSSGTGTTATATFNTNTLTLGTHTITAVYAANPASQTPPNFLGSSSTAVTVVVSLPPSPTTTTLTPVPNPSWVGQNVTLTAAVMQGALSVSVPPGAGNPGPTGTVSFYDGTNLLGTGTLVASTSTLSTATFITNSLTLGTHSLTAVYAGDTYNLTSTSNAVSQVVTPSTFTMAIDPTSMTVAIGSTATAKLTITDIGGFNEPVSLTCTGATAETACDFAQLIVPAGGGSTTVLLSPSSPHPCGQTVVTENRGPRPMLPVMAGLGALVFLARKRKKLVRGLTLALALCVLPMLNGCGGTSGCTDFGVLPGTYSFTVTATSLAPMAITHTQTVTITVKP